MTHLGVKVTINEEILITSPKCPHGPTVIFERGTKGSTKSFYACSANRDRKLCSFYQLISDNGVLIRQKRNSFSQALEKHDSQKNFTELWNKFKKLPAKERKFCKTCGIPIEKDDNDHQSHIILNEVQDKLLTRPTSLLEPITENKGIAQFHFDIKTTKTLRYILTHLKVSHVLCIGVPSLFEELSKVLGISSFMLDIDQRLTRLLPHESAAQYNMFNHHFFDESEGRASYLNFLSSARQNDVSGSKLLVVVDPPFGAMVELLLFGLFRISKDFFAEHFRDQSVQTLMALPYFLEEKISKGNAFSMADMEVTYNNHTKLRKRKRTDDIGDNVSGSGIVRIFTNIALSKVALPVEFGYHFCEICKKYVGSQNKHCSKCKSCTTKIGKTYHHCNICKRCVKANWQHCPECNICELPGRHSKRRGQKISNI